MFSDKVFDNAMGKPITLYPNIKRNEKMKPEVSRDGKTKQSEMDFPSETISFFLDYPTIKAASNGSRNMCPTTDFLGKLAL